MILWLVAYFDAFRRIQRKYKENHTLYGQGKCAGLRDEEDIYVISQFEANLVCCAGGICSLIALMES